MKRKAFIRGLIAFTVLLTGCTGKIIAKKNNSPIGTIKEIPLEQFFENLCFTNDHESEKKILREYYRLCLEKAKLRSSNGLHVLLNPCVDIRVDGKYNKRNAYRTNDPYITGTLAAVAVRAYRDGRAGLAVKHFLTATSQGKSNNTHRKKVEYPMSGKELEKHLIPYRKIFNNTNCSYVMIGHTIVPEIGGKDLPLSISPEGIKYLRDMGFDAIIMSDDLSSMKGVLDCFKGENKQGQAFLAFIKAGGTIAGFMGNREAGKAIDFVLPRCEDNSKDATELVNKIDDALFLILKDKVRIFGDKWLKDAAINSFGSSIKELIYALINTMSNEEKLKQMMWVSFYGNALRNWQGVGGIMMKSKSMNINVNSTIPVINSMHSPPWERHGEDVLVEKYSKITKG